MSDEAPRDGSGGEDTPGWAAPVPVPGAPAPGAPAPAAPPAPTGSWALPPASGVGAPGIKAPRRRRGWIVALVLALGTIAAFGIAGTALFATRTLPPYQGANDFLDDVTAGHEQDAIDRLCAADRDDPEAAFSELDRRIGFGTTVTANFLGVDRDGERAIVEYQVDLPGTGTATGKSYDLPMREEGGDWKACPGASLR